MKHLAALLSSSLLVASWSTSAVADSPSVATLAEARVREALLVPLAKKEESRSKFSRARLPPRERRTHVVAESWLRDGRGRGFVPFVVEVRYGEDWREDVRGCVYEGNGPVYVAVGDEHRRAEHLLGKKTPAVPGVCVEAAAPRS